MPDVVVVAPCFVVVVRLLLLWRVPVPPPHRPAVAAGLGDSRPISIDEPPGASLPDTSPPVQYDLIRARVMMAMTMTMTMTMMVVVVVVVMIRQIERDDIGVHPRASPTEPTRRTRPSGPWRRRS